MQQEVHLVGTHTPFTMELSNVVVYSLNLFTIFANNFIANVLQGSGSTSGDGRPKYSSIKQILWFTPKQSFLRLFCKHHGRFILS